jgi:hypothetical protein
MNSPTETAPLASASLYDPLYYLKNIDTVLAWVVAHHSDLFSAEERSALKTIMGLNTDSRACLCRLVMRRGEWFRDDKLVYSEISTITHALVDLANKGLIQYPAQCQLTALVDLCKVSEIEQLWLLHAQGPIPKGKDALLKGLALAATEQCQPVEQWWPQSPFEVIKLECQALFDTIKVLFFGNAQQDWSEFVLTELGHQRYEIVDLDTQQRAFDNRQALETFLQISALGDALYLGLMPAEAVIGQLPPLIETPWIEYRRQKVLYRAAHAIEREGDHALALSLYRRCLYREAKIRQLRVMEKILPPKIVHRYAGWIMRRGPRDDWRNAAAKVWRRSAAKCGLTATQPTRFKPTLEHLTLEKSATSVERAVAQYLAREDAPCHYVENGLLPGLFALTFWEAWFAPVPGAFFNPFQRRPADLYQDDFVLRRESLIDKAWQSLESDRYQEHILARYEAKKGIANPFAIWSLLNENLLQQALSCIPRAHLKVVFERLWDNLRQHSSGFPDLIQFDLSHQNYQLIEVKGPGDKLQDHQLQWLAFFAQHGINARVCHVQWKTD